MNESLPPVSTDIHELAKSAALRHEQAAHSEWYKEMQAEMGEFERSGFEDVSVLHAGEGLGTESQTSTSTTSHSKTEEEPAQASLNRDGTKLPTARQELQETATPRQKQAESPEQKRRSLRWAHRVGRTALRFVRGRENEQDLSTQTQESAPDVSAENIEMLRSAGRTGELLLPYYEFALKESPTLDATRIINSPAMTARPSFGDGRHQARIPLGEDAPEQVRDTLAADQANLLALAKVMGMSPDEALKQPELLYLHATLHELGHTVQYNQYSGRGADFKEFKDEQVSQMPVPGYQSAVTLAKELKDPDTQASKWVRHNWQSLQEKYGVTTTDDLLAVQAKAKRRLFNERFADNFANRILQKYAEAHKELQAV